MRKLQSNFLLAAMLIAVCGLLSAMQDPELVGLEDLIDGSATIKIPAGEFLMGAINGPADQQPVHRVRISHAFEIGKYEITQAQWETVMSGAHRGPQVDLLTPDGTAVSVKPSRFPGPNRPVENVSWNDVQLFLTRLNARDPHHRYRLPTEAEWEYAARAGGRDELPANIDAAAWFKDNSEGHPHAVGSREPNRRGIYDMEGNVAEWVSDWFGGSYYFSSPKTDPAGPPTGSYRVYRGGSWLDEVKYCKAGLRRFDFPNSRVYNVGFRVVRTAR